MRLVLASASPRRLDLLVRLGLVPDAVDPADLDEVVQPGEQPRPHAERLAREKAALVASRHPGAGGLRRPPWSPRRQPGRSDFRG